ncbi:transposable element Tcb2 transposase [Trichonephila clavipes]|nr:transposable element Tcb2 transposase [Trichonephila clavipes]
MSQCPGERYNSPYNILRHTARTAGVMVWGAIAYDSWSTLIVMRGTLTGQRCVGDILRPNVGSFLNGLPGAIFQQNNARPHTARVAQDFLRHIQTLPCRPAPPIYRWIPRGVSFQRPRPRIIAVASLGRLSRNRSIPVWFTRYPRTALSDRWRSLGITSLMNIGGIRYVHIPSYIGHHDQACVLA